MTDITKMEEWDTTKSVNQIYREMIGWEVIK